MTYQNIPFVQILYYLTYIAVIAYGIIKFYNKLLTPYSWLRKPFPDCFLVTLVLLLPMSFFSVENRMFSSTYFLILFLAIVLVFFRNKLYIKISCYFLAVLSYAFIELIPSSFFFVANLFIKNIDLIPQHFINNGFVCLSLIYFLLIDIFFLYFIFILANSFQGRFSTLPMTLIVCLSIPFLLAVLSCNIVEESRSYFDFTIKCAIMLPAFTLSLFLLSMGFKKLKQQELLTLQREAQESQLKHLLEYYKKIEKNYITQRKFKHDIANHLSIISFLLEERKYKETEAYLSDYINTRNSTEDMSYEI